MQENNAHSNGYDTYCHAVTTCNKIGFAFTVFS